MAKKTAPAKSKNRLGWVPDVPDHRDFAYAAPLATLAALPPKIDLRPHCPPVYNQGALGSCTANAIGAAFQFDRMRQNLPSFVPSRLFLYYNERAMEGSVASDAGAMIRDGIKSMKHQGDCPETQRPYIVSRFAVKPPPQCYTSALKFQVVSYQRVARTLGQMRGCIASGFPFVFGVSCYTSFLSAATAATGDIAMPAQAETLEGGHAILCTGYDDSKQRFNFRNSWGTGWGNGGYGTIPYAYLLDPNLGDDYWTIRLVE